MKKSLPQSGLGQAALQKELDELRARDLDSQFKDWSGRCFMFNMRAGDAVQKVAEAAYMQYFKTDALSSVAYPSVKGFQEDLLAFSAALFRGGDPTEGTVTTGGTESIILAMRCARDWAREARPGVKVPGVLCPRTAHPAFNKGAELLGMHVVRVPEGPDFRADLEAMKGQIGDDTIMLVGSMPTYWHGACDQIPELGELALANHLWLHVDACMGGFLAPFVRKTGRPVVPFDFSVAGVRSISADLHKYGFTPKGASVVMFSDAEEAGPRIFDWKDPYIHYATPGLSGTRSGAAIAAAWAVMRLLGEEGYVEIARKIMQARDVIVEGIRSIEGLEIRGEAPLSIISFGATEADTMAVGGALQARGWMPNVWEGPPSLHLRLLPSHAAFAEEFVEDLRKAVEEVLRGEVKTADHAGMYAE